VYRVVRANDGAVRWVIAHGEAVFSPVGTALRYVGTIQDITDRRRDEQALQESEARLRLAIDAGRMAVWSYDVSSQTLQGSPELNRLLGFAADDEPTRAQMEAGYLPGERERVTHAGSAALAQGERFFEVEYQYRRVGGQVCWLLLRAEIILNEESQPRRVIGVVLDITERRTAEEQQKMLSAELAHRGKNTIAVVQSISTLTFRNATSVEEAARSFAQRLSALAHANDRLTEAPGSECLLYDLATSIFGAFGPEIQARIDVSGPSVVVPPALALALSLVLHELVVNALKHGALSGETGKVQVGWSILDDRRMAFHWQESGGPPVATPSRSGFGSVLLKRSLSAYLDGELAVQFKATGLECSFVLRGF
jgi:PAS domain S-box-containing protein